ncbi:tRNA synthetase class II (D K and N) [Anaeromyxobacter dehalogenans 2CP-1]|uniref:tRNA synthetase class II (D K and N) n=1 Tax=Anaeromyxobacter dehalogenans (strain ATCC BAA-258 / DSM 21875 / 2CP-1) TaxID=455488 RepID=B8J7L0_ANAD2|nr:EF-P lysine aminoacylase EpmA [Anaeromyxobacter dehalogenans]ACL67190.1 tRNA synthetase class II (D K and N) [Anaeromyxobacter dehalogenans 2CP-1]
MSDRRREAARARARLSAEVRRILGGLGYEEVETPSLVPAPGMEPHIDAFQATFVPEGGGASRPLWLQNSPEYAMKRLLADGFERVFQLARVFRNGEVSRTHNPEFTMLEFYRAGTDYRGMMADLEALLEGAARALLPGGEPRVTRNGRALWLGAPFETLTVAEAFRRHAGVDLEACAGDADRLARAAREAGHDPGPPGEPFDDVFFRVMLDAVEPRLGVDRPTWLVDWPASMAALSKVKAGDPRWAERFELYAGGLELANGFTELTDAREQRARLVEEQALRRRLGRPAYPLDERFLEAVGRMPEAGGVAVGFDRVLMLLTGGASIEDVLLFPAHGFWD